MATVQRRASAAWSRKTSVLSRRYIEGLIADGKAIIIIDDAVLNADVWLPFHPGGDKALRHMFGRDATDEITAFHSVETRQYMKSFQIGRIDEPWHNFTPPIQGGHFRSFVDVESHQSQNSFNDRISCYQGDDQTSSDSDVDLLIDSIRRRRNSESSTPSSPLSLSFDNIDVDKAAAHINRLTRQQIELDNSKYPPTDLSVQKDIVAKYRALYQRLLDERYFECNYLAYAKELARYLGLTAAFLFFLHWGWFATSGLCLGLLWHQLVFTVHDAGHMGITHNYTIDTLVGMTIASHIGGLSLGWWKRNHNVHHVVTNSPEHDPDIEHMPFFMISHQFFASLRSTYYDRIMKYDAFAKSMARYQKFLYYPVLLFGRFNLYVLSWNFLLGQQAPKRGRAWWHRWYEIGGQIFFWTWYGYLVVYRSIPTNSQRLGFILVSHFVTAPLHVQITLSHFAMSTSNLGVDESFPQKMLRTTMDVDCPAWLDFVHGGLQFQAIHHLYPRMPRHNLRSAQALVQRFCDEAGIPYALFGFVDGNKQVIGRLADVGRQARILAQCQQHIADHLIQTGSVDTHI